MPARLPITDEERRERKRVQDHNAHIRRMERIGFKPRGFLIPVTDAGELRRRHCKDFGTQENHPCA